jgi:hypothetical protein
MPLALNTIVNGKLLYDEMYATDVAAREGELSENLDKTYYVYLPPELCLVHPLLGSLVRGAQRLPSVMRRVESMLLAIQLKDIIGYPVPATKVYTKNTGLENFRNFTKSVVWSPF